MKSAILKITKEIFKFFKKLWYDLDMFCEKYLKSYKPHQGD